MKFIIAQDRDTIINLQNVCSIRCSKYYSNGKSAILADTIDGSTFAIGMYSTSELMERAFLSITCDIAYGNEIIKILKEEEKIEKQS